VLGWGNACSVRCDQGLLIHRVHHFLHHEFKKKKPNISMSAMVVVAGQFAIQHIAAACDNIGNRMGLTCVGGGTIFVGRQLSG
jgi:hypothetical protein